MRGHTAGGISIQMIEVSGGSRRGCVAGRGRGNNGIYKMERRERGWGRLKGEREEGGGGSWLRGLVI